MNKKFKYLDSVNFPSDIAPLVNSVKKENALYRNKFIFDENYITYTITKYKVPPILTSKASVAVSGKVSKADPKPPLEAAPGLNLYTFLFAHTPYNEPLNSCKMSND